jgi:hypothetical protein
LGGFAFRGIDRQLAFSYKRRAQAPRDAMSRFTNAYFGATGPRNARLRPRGQVIPEVVIEAPGISPARKPTINVRPTGDGEACEDPRTLRIGQEAARTGNDIRDLELISQHAERVMVHADQIEVTLRSGQFPARRCKSLLVSINSLFGTIKFPGFEMRALPVDESVLARRAKSPPLCAQWCPARASSSIKNGRRPYEMTG